MDMKPIIVMAGTPVDTQMGMDCLSTQGLPGVFCPISEDPNQQTAFQISSTEEKIDALKALGFHDFDFYQTLLRNPMYTNEVVEDVVPGYQSGGYVAIIAHK